MYKVWIVRGIYISKIDDLIFVNEWYWYLIWDYFYIRGVGMCFECNFFVSVFYV